MKETKKVHFEDKKSIIEINRNMSNIRLKKKSIHDFPVYPILKQDKVDILAKSLNTMKLRHKLVQKPFNNRTKPRTALNAELPVIKEEPIQISRNPPEQALGLNASGYSNKAAVSRFGP